jgi:hypothetical protein
MSYLVYEDAVRGVSCRNIIDPSVTVTEFVAPTPLDDSTMYGADSMSSCS